MGSNSNNPNNDTKNVIIGNYVYYMLQRLLQSGYCQYLDGSVYVGFLASKVDQASNSDAVRQIIDEGNIVDKVLCFSNTKYDDGSNTLKIRAKNHC